MCGAPSQVGDTKGQAVSSSTLPRIHNEGIGTTGSYTREREMTPGGRLVKRSSSSSRIARRVVAGAVIALLVTACGGADDSSSPTSAPADDVCQDAEALRSSVDELKDVDLVAEGTNGANAAISAVKDDLAAISESAGDELRPQVQAVEDSIDELETKVDNNDGAAAALEAVSKVASSASTLVGSLEDGACD
jgi:hypothetical protein